MVHTHTHTSTAQMESIQIRRTSRTAFESHKYTSPIGRKKERQRRQWQWQFDRIKFVFFSLLRLPIFQLFPFDVDLVRSSLSLSLSVWHTENTLRCENSPLFFTSLRLSLHRSSSLNVFMFLFWSVCIRGAYLIPIVVIHCSIWVRLMHLNFDARLFFSLTSSLALGSLAEREIVGQRKYSVNEWVSERTWRKYILDFQARHNSHSSMVFRGVEKKNDFHVNSELFHSSVNSTAQSALVLIAEPFITWSMDGFTRRFLHRKKVYVRRRLCSRIKQV